MGTLLTQEIDRLRGDLAVGLLGVGAISGEPADRASVVAGADKDFASFAFKFSLSCAGRDADREDLILVVAVASAGIPDAFPGLRVVESVGADLLGDTVVVELADPSDSVAVVLEQLRHRDHVRDHFPEFLGVVVDAGRVRTQAREEGRAARVTESVLAVGTVETDSFSGEGVDVRRQGRAAIGAHAGATVIGDEE